MIISNTKVQSIHLVVCDMMSISLFLSLLTSLGWFLRVHLRTVK